MKKIDFGYNNGNYPINMWEGCGIKNGIFLQEADYYGSVEIDGDYYVIAKVTNSQFNACPQLLNQFIVRQALCDVFADGSCIIRLNQDETTLTKQLEKVLNNTQVKERITKIEDVIDLSDKIKRSSNLFYLAELSYGNIYSISMLSDEFEKMNTARKKSDKTFLAMQVE